MNHADRSPTAADVSTAAVGMTVGAVIVVAAWWTVGPDHSLFPLLVTLTWFGVAAVVGSPLAAVLPQSWLRVPPREVRWHARLGVGLYDRALEVIGWNRVVRGMRRDAGPLTRSSLPGHARHVASSMAGHGVGTLAHLLVALACLLWGALGNAAAIVMTGAVVQCWPMLLQRSTAARMQRLHSTVRTR